MKIPGGGVGGNSYVVGIICPLSWNDLPKLGLGWGALHKNHVNTLSKYTMVSKLNEILHFLLTYLISYPTCLLIFYLNEKFAKPDATFRLK